MENLPVVNPVIGAAIAQNMSKESDIKYLKDSLRLLERTNPCIAWWIKNYSKSTKDKIGSAYCGLMVYSYWKTNAKQIISQKKWKMLYCNRSVEMGLARRG